MITCVLFGVALVAQGQAPVFRSRIDLLQLDVTVLDKDGRPVRGLTQADFVIIEDKKPQTIEAFTAVDIPDATVPKAVWANTVAPDVTSNEIDNQRIFVIVMDDARSMGLNDQKIPDPWAVREMKKTVALFFDTLSATDLVGLVYTNATRDSQSLTQDHARLLKAIQAYPEDGGGMLIPMAGAHMDPCLGMKYTVGTIQAVVNHLATIPDRRKAVVYFGGELPFVGPGYAQPCILGPWWQQTIEAAQQAHVTINPIDTMGFRRDGNPSENYTSLAEVTGGHAIAATSDFAPGIKQIFLENSSYYLMAYQPTNEIEDGTFRRLTVSVKGRPGLDVRTRRSYWAPKRKITDPDAPAPPPQLEALAGVLPVSQLPLRVTAAPFASASSGSAATVTLALGVRQPPFAARTPEQIELLIKAYTVDGDPKGSDSQTIPITVPAARPDREQSRYEVLARVDLPKPGKYQLRLSAHSVVADTRGSVYVDIEVPDFRKDAVSLSGVVMNNALAADPVAPTRILRDVVPLVPTSERAFATTDIITALVRVYQGGDKVASVPLEVTIKDAAGKSVFAKSETIGAERFSAERAADYQVRLPLATLKAGDHLLTFESTVGKITARRDVRFQVR